ncbi:NifU N-terminal domain-containing protein [Paenibacillus chibensis]|uniref:NifU N-terminal domain-containing protein n=1 Tax=Paenibacillus chibensis TaxID=59846 RepID=A0ABU6PRE7_9BACL|nr:NifU N-terminal domain-containing protein [Paenibacillus chibensis]MEC0373612.1 NifU N-terminal domain-containing protein [Paenibacillus chibensis]MED5016698.1 NifU N-terminal domain-containing protein [Paenibacillus chibensis]
MTVEFQVQATPNPNSIKINTNTTLFEGPKSTSLKSGEATDHPLASALIRIEGVDNIFGIRDFVTISKTPDADWDDILPQVEAAFNSVYA